MGIPKAGRKGKRAEVLGQDRDKEVRKGQRDGNGRRVPALAASLSPSLLCTQGLPTPMCTLRLLAAFPTRVSTPLWPISSIFITFCNAQSRVPNLKSALFPNVTVISTPGPSGCVFPNAELWLVGAARSPAPHSQSLALPPGLFLMLSPGLRPGMPGVSKDHVLLLATVGHLLFSGCRAGDHWT